MGRFDGMSKRYEEHDLESGRFLKFDDGDKHVVAFLGDPFIREIYWENQKTHPWTPGCGKPKSLKTSMNVALLERAQAGFQIIGVKVLENSKTFYKQVAKMDAKYGIESKVFEIERDGTGTDTTYSILPEADIAAALRAELDALELFDLEKDEEDESEAKGGRKTGHKPDKAPEPAAIITQADGNSLIERLKSLKAALGAQGDQMTADFLATFSLAKIRDLPAKRLKEAQTWIAQEEEAARHAAADGGEPGDPFA